MDIFQKYSTLVKDCPIKEIGEKINYYLSDDLKLNISMNNLIDIDMKSAFPNICRLLWPNSDFVNKLFSIESKLEKNIYLTNSLIKLKEETNINYLVTLNNYAKMLVLGHIYNTYSDITIFEFKKDGVIFKGTELNGYIDAEFSEFINSNFQFHVQEISQYYRLTYLRTSIYRYRCNVEGNITHNYIFKGQIKEIPKFLNDVFFNGILIDDLYDIRLQEFVKIYSMERYLILKKLGFNDKIKEYYLFNNKGYIQFNNKILESNHDFNPCFVLYNFVYPLLAMSRSEV